MKKMEITREQVIAQMKQDSKLEKEFANSFYSIRMSQLKEILKNGEGTFSIFKNEEAYIVIK